jgi:hypothetical protein
LSLFGFAAQARNVILNAIPRGILTISRRIGQSMGVALPCRGQRMFHGLLRVAFMGSAAAR